MRTRTRNFKDPNQLTDYEKSIHELRQQGLTWNQIAERLGQKMVSVRNRYPVIKEKLEYQENAHK